MERQGNRRTARQYTVELETARLGEGETGKQTCEGEKNRIWGEEEGGGGGGGGEGGG